VGAAWHSWVCGWGHNEVTINTNNYNNFTKNNYTNAQKYQKAQNAKTQQWQHNPEHRKGAAYRDQATAQSSGSSGRAQAPGRLQMRREGMAVQATGAAAERKQENSAAAAAGRALSAAPTEGAASAPPASGGRRAAVLPIGAWEAAPEAAAHRGAAASWGRSPVSRNEKYWNADEEGRVRN